MGKGKLLPVQIFTLTTSVTLGVSILMVQQELASIAGQDAWISMLLGGFITLLAGSMLYYLAALHTKLDLPEIVLKVAGSIFGRIILLPLTAYVLVDTGVTIRVFAQALKLFLLDRTPVFIIIGLFIIVLVSVAVRGINTVAAVADLLFPFFLLSILLVIGLAVTESDLIYLKPVLYKNTAQVFQASLPAYGALIGYGSISFLVKYVPEPKKVLRWFLAGIVLSVILYTLLTIETIAVFGPIETKSLMFPILFLSKAIDVQTTFIERLEAFLVLIWIPAVFTSLAIYIFTSIRNIVVLFNTAPKHHTAAAWLHVPVLFAIAQFSQNEIQSLYYLRRVDEMGLIQVIVIVPLLLILTFFYNKRKAPRS